MEPYKISPHSIITVINIILLTFNYHPAATYFCNELLCTEETASYNNPCQAPRNCSTIGFRTFLDPGKCNCCEYCFDYLEEDDPCDEISPQKPIEMCGPHLTCTRGKKSSDPTTCQRMNRDPDAPLNPDSCRDMRADYENKEKEGIKGIAQVNPECDAHGYYSPRQCLKGSVCYCSSLHGRRLFGLALPEENQDCACARDVDRLTRELGFEGRLPHCLPNGDYDELQCVVRSCFCRSHPDIQTPLHQMNESLCYDPKIHIFEPGTPRYYMRDCELQRARIEIQIAEAQATGAKVIWADVPKCDPDGNFAAIQTDFDRKYCANPGGAKIENFEVGKFTWEADEMNCFCARDRYMLQDAATGKPKCCLNGNYRPWQVIGRKYYCVDDKGRQDMTEWKWESEVLAELHCYSEKYKLSCEAD